EKQAAMQSGGMSSIVRWRSPGGPWDRVAKCVLTIDKSHLTNLIITGVILLLKHLFPFFPHYHAPFLSAGPAAITSSSNVPNSRSRS
ncbi:unnamed protein product, partial [Allacma fusca]